MIELYRQLTDPNDDTCHFLFHACQTDLEIREAARDRVSVVAIGTVWRLQRLIADAIASSRHFESERKKM